MIALAPFRAAIAAGARRREFHAVQVSAVARNGGEIEMRIRAGIAVAGEMFRGGEAAILLDAAHERGDEFGNARRVFAERARIDDGIVGIAVDVGVRRENPRNSDRSAFQRRNLSHRVGVFGAACGGDGHGVRKRRALFDAHGGAALEIRGDEQRNFGVALQGVHKDGRRVDLAAYDADGRALCLDRKRADVLFLDIAEKILVVLALGGKERTVGPHGEKLPDFFIERHGLESLRDPAFGFGGKFRRFRRGRRARRFLCAARGSHQEDSEQQETPTQRSHRADSNVVARMPQSYIAPASGHNK